MHTESWQDVSLFCRTIRQFNVDRKAVSVVSLI